jgi:cysteine desulfurase
MRRAIRAFARGARAIDDAASASASASATATARGTSRGTRAESGRRWDARERSRARGMSALAQPVSAPIEPEFEMKGVTLRGRPLYLDMQATTPLDPRVLDAMLPYFTEQYGNPHSRTHMYGWETEDAIEKARGELASLIGANAKEIVFTSGATESNNMSLKGVARFYKDKKKHIITTTTEHKCVLDSCRQLEREGFDVTYLPVKENGLVDLKELEAAMRDDTAIVSVMAVNNEIGVIQPLKAIGELCRSKKIFFHTDGAQAVGKVPMDVNDMNIDLMSISGHKFYGPKGIGALYVRRRPRVRMEPIINGGGQERGLRSGTLPTPLIVGIGEAARVAQKELQRDEEHVNRLAKRLIEGIESRVEHTQLNGDREARYHGNVNMSFAYVEGESMLMGLKEIAVSSGSACTSASLEPSYVLRALGVNEEMAHTSVRYGLGRFTTEAEVDRAIEATVRQVEKLREMSPLWEMVQEGIDLKTIEWSQH